MIRKPRILLYSHDTFGLGHLRRTLSVAEQLHRDLPGVHQLVLTGSMVAGAFGLPPRLDLVKLPALSKRTSGEYKARALPLSLRQTLAWREQMILQAVRTFEPHVVLVDKVAAGVHGELLPALRELKTWRPETALVLGMRDIEDSPEVTRAEWRTNHTPQLMESVYDAILLYGQRDLFDPVSAYCMPSQAAAKLVSCGYLRRDGVRRNSEAVRRELGATRKPLVVVTVGGGGDGYEIIHTTLEMLVSRPAAAPYHTLIVTGPLMPDDKRGLLRRAAALPGVTLLEFTPDMISYLAAADLVVSMAGYNTVCELLSLSKRALLIPRVQMRVEQRLRAEALAARGLAHVLLPDTLSPSRLSDAIDQALASPPPAIDLPLDGLRQASQAIQALLAQPSTRRASASLTL